MPTVTRRSFLALGAATAAAASLPTLRLEAGSAPTRDLPWNPVTATAMPTRNLGRTGFRVGIFGLGGQAALEQPQNEAVAVPLIERAIALGVNYVDTSARYGGEARWSEQYFGKALKRLRSQVFLATKSHDRTRDGSLRLLETSLKLLGTDHVDLWQMHAMTTEEDVTRAFAKGGAIEAFTRAREEGLVRFLGISGHTDPAILMACLKRFPFDTALLALNAADPHHLSFAKDLLPLCLEQQVGVIAMKIPSRGRLLSRWTPPPVESQRGAIKATRPGTLTMREAFDYVLSLPVATAIIGCDSMAQLEENLALARTFTPLPDARLRVLEEKARPVAQQALWYRRW